MASRRLDLAWLTRDLPGERLEHTHTIDLETWAAPRCVSEVTLHDETFRDGLQSPSISEPPLDAMIRVLHQLADLGVGHVNVGLPAAGPRALESATTLCREIATERLGIEPCIAARTKVEDIEPAVELAQKTGTPVRVMAFIGCSPIRIYAESWTLDMLKRLSTKAIAFAVKEGLSVTYVTEDTTRSRPETLRTLFDAAIEEGADRLCLCDTCGHATPNGARRLVQFTRAVVEERGTTIGIDWHGHDDRGLALPNALAAADAGADRVHGCVLGIGERVGNAALDMLLLNLAFDGGREPRIDALMELCESVSSAMGRPIPIDYPLRMLAEQRMVHAADVRSTSP